MGAELQAILSSQRHGIGCLAHPFLPSPFACAAHSLPPIPLTPLSSPSFPRSDLLFHLSRLIDPSVLLALQWVSKQDSNDKVIVVERGDLLMVFNFHRECWMGRFFLLTSDSSSTHQSGHVSSRPQHLPSCPDGRNCP